jgi:hypothetical protein
LQGANTLAYFVSAVEMKKSSFVTLTPGDVLSALDNLINILSLVAYGLAN